MKYAVTHIEWETDGVPVDLPTEAIVEAESPEEIADALSDIYGWLILTFTATELQE